MAKFKNKYYNNFKKKTSKNYNKSMDKLKRKMFAKNYKQETPNLSFSKRVQYVISKNVENKFTALKSYSDSVGEVVNSGTPNIYFYTFYTWTPGAQSNSIYEQILNLSQGTAQAQRVGNQIKLKRWVIKGVISPNIFGIMAPYTALGYVDVYFGKYKLNNSAIDPQLIQLYQNGNTAITPSMINTDILCPLNKDVYKIYFHRRFKMGGAGFVDTKPPQGGNPGGTFLPVPSEPPNNDYKLTQTFGFDVCNFVCKDRIIKYADGTTIPMDSDIQNLTLFATFTPFTGQAFNNTSPAGEALPTYFNIAATSYIEYEDA